MGENPDMKEDSSSIIGMDGSHARELPSYLSALQHTRIRAGPDHHCDFVEKNASPKEHSLLQEGVTLPKTMKQSCLGSDISLSFCRINASKVSAS